jgi:hypothetical protein
MDVESERMRRRPSLCAMSLSSARRSSASCIRSRNRPTRRTSAGKQKAVAAQGDHGVLVEPGNVIARSVQEEQGSEIGLKCVMHRTCEFGRWVHRRRGDDDGHEVENEPEVYHPAPVSATVTVLGRGRLDAASWECASGFTT